VPHPLQPRLRQRRRANRRWRRPARLPKTCLLGPNRRRPRPARRGFGLRSFTSDPAAIVSYGPLEDRGRPHPRDRKLAAGERSFRRNARRRCRPQRRRTACNTSFMCRASGCRSRTNPTNITHADLVGLAVVDRVGKPLGTVVAVHRFRRRRFDRGTASGRRADAAPSVRCPDRGLTSTRGRSSGRRTAAERE